jgi:hypothetical protein
MQVATATGTIVPEDFSRKSNCSLLRQDQVSWFVHIVEIMARVSTSDSLYLIQTVLSPKRY